MNKNKEGPKLITTVTINPAIDYTFKTDKLDLDKVNRVEFARKVPAGKGINVAKTVNNLKEEVKTLGCLAKNNGDYIVDYLNKQGVITDFNWREGEVRINAKVIDQKHKTKINQYGEEVPTEILTKVKQKIKDNVLTSEIIVLSGSLPPGCPDNYYKEIIKEIKKIDQQTKVFLDAAKEPLKLGLEAKPDLIKPNRRELEELWGQELSFSEVVDASQKLVEQGIEIVIVSLGAKGAILATKEQVLHAFPPQVEVYSTVGAGDSLVGAAAVGYIRGYKIRKILKFAIAMSTATVLLPAAEVGSLAKTESLLEQIKVNDLRKK